MTRALSILLALVLAMIGSGGAGYLHALEHHHHDDAGLTTSGVSMRAGDDHAEDACPTCATLHMPLLSGSLGAVVLICLGLSLASPVPHEPGMISRRVALRLPCRGPPAV